MLRNPNHNFGADAPAKREVMAKITGALISAELAAFLKEKLGELPKGSLRCPQCHQPVTPFPTGPGKPHFEHAPGSHDCLLGGDR